uniref:Uncharacterized protein n=1 Tax=Oryza nivara TaxID=4536 RepID=A0A0E0HY58_ORYNI
MLPPRSQRDRMDLNHIDFAESVKQRDILKPLVPMMLGRTTIGNCNPEVEE